MNLVIIIIISIISITALVMACIAFSKTFKNNRERFIDDKGKKINVIFLINAYKYPDKATEILLDSIKDINFKVLIISYGKQVELKKIKENVYNLVVIQNSIDFTAFIAVLEHENLLKKHDLVPEFWFYTHNTTKCGKNFAKKIYFDETRRLTNDSPSMNIGTYKHKDLVKVKDFILALRSSDHPSMEECKKNKEEAIRSEDDIFKKIGADKAYSRRETKEATNVYSKGVKRITEYYPELDFYKFKANWGQRRKGDPIMDQ